MKVNIPLLTDLVIIWKDFIKPKFCKSVRLPVSLKQQYEDYFSSEDIQGIQALCPSICVYKPVYPFYWNPNGVPCHSIDHVTVQTMLQCGPCHNMDQVTVWVMSRCQPFQFPVNRTSHYLRLHEIKVEQLKLFRISKHLHTNLHEKYSVYTITASFSCGGKGCRKFRLDSWLLLKLSDTVRPKSIDCHSSQCFIWLCRSNCLERMQLVYQVCILHVSSHLQMLLYE